MEAVYFDNAATTKLRNEVVETMYECLLNNFGNASSTHSFGRESKVTVEQCRKDIATHFGITASEIVFTSGGTEADNLVLQSCVRDFGVTHIITSKIEHHAVLHTVEYLERNFNVSVDYVAVEKSGQVSLSHLEELLQKSDDKTLVSLMHVNNEIGSILPVDQVGKLCREHNALFHTDAVQSIGHFNLNLNELPIDFLAASAHKFHGPKGVGFAIIRKGNDVKPMILGGEQERGCRAGTEAVHNILGMTKALNIAYQELEKDKKHITALKNHFVTSLKQMIPEVVFNGDSQQATTNTYTIVNVCLPVSKEKGTLLLFQLDLKGIACSKGSACQSGSDKGSHVLAEILSDDEMTRPSIRFSFSIFNTIEEVDYVVETLSELVKH